MTATFEHPVDPDATYRLIIGGDQVEAGNGTYAIVNPATEQVVGHAPDATAADAQAAAQAAADAFPAWSRTSPQERATLLNRVADLLDAHHEELVPLTQAETGATLQVTRTMQVPQAAARFRYYAGLAGRELEIPVPPSIMPNTALAPGGLVNGLARRAPVGVVAAITSYNFPLTNTAGKLGPALAMGNTIVVKPAPQDPLAIIKLGEIFTEAGFPPGVLNVLVGAGAEAGAALVASPQVDMVSFTGSTSVGQTIGGVAGSQMKRLLMELGGKGACVVFDDADLKGAIGAIASVWAFHSGQICTSPTRVLAQRGIYDQLVAGLAAAADSFKVGDPLELDTIVGPVITDVHRSRVEGYVASGLDQGATLSAGGKRPDLDTGFFVAPTLLSDVTIDMKVAQEEIFGPVVVVIPFDSQEEGIELANATEFGLYDYVFSGDTSRAYQVAQQLRAGNVGVNTAQRNFELPFGGFKQSGVGRDGGRFGLHAYSELQSIVWPG